MISAFLALAAVGVAAALLSSADEVFSGMITGALDWASRIDGSIVPKIIGAFLLGMAMFSFGYGLFRKPLPMHRAAAPKGTPVMFGTVLGALILVYGVFAYVQMRYLFAGEVSVSMSGGYAAYARSGFFQLVLVAFLTLALILPSLIVCRESRCVRLLSAAAALLTAVIDFSAFFRMRLYIGAYGLSTLRVITLWGIGMIMLALCMALIKAAWPAVRICPFLAAALLATWVALNYANVDRMVSQDLVARFNAGINPTGSDDEDRIAASLASDGYWRPAYYTAFEQISDPDVRQAALDMLHARAGAADEDGRLLSRPPAYDWCFSCLLVPEGNTGQIMADGQ